MRDPLSRNHRRRDKYCRVIPASQRLMARITTQTCLPSRVNGEVVRITDLVGPVTTAACVAEIAGHSGGKCLTALCAGNAADLPSANDCIGNTSQVSKELPPTANWQLIDVAHHEPVPKIRQHWAVLPLGMVRVLDLGAYVSIGISQIVGKRVRGEEIESV